MDQEVSRIIKFGTDGWRGIIGFDFNIENLSKVAVAACQELDFRFFNKVKSKKILIGFDRRFMADYFAKSIIPYINAKGFETLLASSCVTTPSCSLYTRDKKLLGALIITASHNPHNWLGLKIKNFQGCSVNDSFTKAVETRIKLKNIIEFGHSDYEEINIRKFYTDKISSNFDSEFIIESLKRMKIKIFFDSMHGSSANYINYIFKNNSNIINCIRENNDPYFGGNPPEPLNQYLGFLKETLKNETKEDFKTIGIIFDGDGDRFAVLDEMGRYCSTQILFPYLIKYLGTKNQNSYPVLKTVSCSDIISKISKKQNRQVFELPVGFKFIAERMINEKIFMGGEESGGLGFGQFLPERDGLFSAMIMLSGIAEQSKYLYESLDEIQNEFGPSFYDRIDIAFSDNNKKDNLRNFILKNVPKKVGEYPVLNVSTIDGIKLRLDDNYWILFRFSGTEPLLRLYCEAPSKDSLYKALAWSKEFINGSI